ncbi:carbohydrate ABC transporter permease [Paenibacillus cymbidii]|uniref:carbohydrate ABC transporter permease n=1 Tax=Paenibacillus cymbidii TaxID=1639034 RepID=UPI00107FE8CB|nr:carbohydrate ABC transporter permease [Paenibacillus cymbidii]
MVKYQMVALATVLLVSFVSLYPLVYIVATSLVNEQEWIDKGGLVLWPSHPTLLAYERLFAGSTFVNALKISIERTVVGTIVTLSLTTITAYIASRHHLPGRKGLIFCILLTILFPSGLVPTYVVMKELHLLDSFWSLIVPMAIDSWSVLVLKQFFESMPKELEEAAIVDGAGEGRLMMSVMVPMSAPAMAAIGLFIAVAHWNAWFDALIYVNDKSLYPIQLLIRNLLVNPELGRYFNPINVLDASNRVSVESLKMAVVVFGTVPILCVYPFLQKYFTKGVYMGAVKG